MLGKKRGLKRIPRKTLSHYFSWYVQYTFLGRRQREIRQLEIERRATGIGDVNDPDDLASVSIGIKRIADLVAFVVSRADGSAELHLQPEQRAILARTREPVSVAELASHLDLALGVVRVLLGDLLQQGLIEIHEPEYDQSVVGPQRPDDRILKAVVNGLRAL